VAGGGGARDSEMRYVHSTAGQQAFEDASAATWPVGARPMTQRRWARIDQAGYVPHASSRRWYRYKGGMIYTCCSWVIGDCRFDKKR